MPSHIPVRLKSAVFAALVIFFTPITPAVSLAAPPNVEWQTTINAPEPQDPYSVGYDIEPGSGGSVYLGGYNWGALGGHWDFEDEPITIKFKNNTAVDWINKLDSSLAGHTYCLGVDYDAAGSVYAVGYTWGTISGGGRVNPDEPFDNTDLYAVKYNSAGAVQWLRQIGTDGYDDLAWGVEYDPAGYVFVVGETGGDMEGQGMTPYGYQDMLVMKLDASDGSTVWVRQLGTSGYDNATAAALDGSGNLYVSGSTEGALGGEFNHGGDDIFLVRLDPADGAHTWTRLTGTTAGDYGNGMGVDSAGSVYIGGSTSGEFPPAENPDLQDDFLVVKYSPSAVEQWVRQLHSAGPDTGYGLAVDSRGNSYIVGTTSNAFDGYSSLGGSDFAVVKHGKDGNRIWSWLYGSDAEDGGYGVGVSSAGKVFVTGYVRGMLGGTIPMTGLLDLFVVMLNQGMTSLVTAPADGVNLTGTSYTITGIADRGSGPPVTKVEVSPDGGTNWYNATDTSGDGSWSSWSYDWTLPSEGDYNIKSRATNTSLFVETPSAGVFISVDNSKPVGSISINSGADYAASQDVTLSVSATDYSGVASMRFSNFSSSGWGAWEPYATSKQWTLEAGDGTKTVYAMFMDSHGIESDVCSDEIYLDIIPPVSSITDPVGGSTVGNSATYTIRGTADDGPGAGVLVVYVFIDDGFGWRDATDTSGDRSWSTWECVWVLPPSDTYSIQTRTFDRVGNQETPGPGISVTVDNIGPTTTLWTRQTGTPSSDYAWGGAVDSSGNVYVAGSTDGGFEGYTSAGGDDLYVLKYDTDGNRLWVRQMGTTLSDVAFDAAVDDSGNVYVAGNTEGDLDGQTNAGGYDQFVVKFDSDGNKLRTNLIGSSGYDAAYGVCSDGTGNVYTTGNSDGVFGGYSSAGGTDVLTVKCNSEGNVLWTGHKGLDKPDTGSNLAVDTYGNVYVVGWFEVEAGYYNSDIIVIKYDAAGNERWARQIDSTSAGQSKPEHANDVAVDSEGNVYVVGWTNASLGGETYAGGISDLFLMKLDEDGNDVWTKLLGTPESDIATSVYVDANGNAYVAGETEGGLGGNTNAGEYDAFVVKYDINGNIQWLRQYGSEKYEESNSVFVDAQGNVYLTGFAATLVGGISIGDEDPVVTKMSCGIRINGDASFTNDTSVTLDLGVFDEAGVDKMQFSNHSTTGWSAWQDYATTASWTLEPGVGQRTVYARFKDTLGNESAVLYDTILSEFDAPASSVTDPVEGGIITGTLYAVTGTSTDGPQGSGVAGVVVSTDGGNNWYAATDTSGDGSWSSWSYGWSVPDAGPYNIVSKATDDLGNVEVPGAGVNVTAKSALSAGRAGINLNHNLARPPAMTSVIIDAAPWQIACDAASTKPWLTVSPSSGATPSEFVLTVDPAGMTAGNYTTTISVSSGLATNSPLGVPLGVTVTDVPPGPELEHYGWEAFMSGDCGVCHLTPGEFLSGPHVPGEPDCRSCHNAASVAHESTVMGGYGHSVMASVTTAGIVAPTYGNVTAAEFDNQPFANLEGGDLVVCSTCHNAMRKTEDYGRVWEKTATSDYLTYYLEAGGWANYGHVEPVVYRSTGLISAPSYSKARKGYVVDSSEYTYDETAGTVTLAAAQDPADFVYVTLRYPYLRASSEADRLCSDCHAQATHMGLNCLACHSAHNTDNVAGIRAAVRTPGGAERAITFTSYSGPGSFGAGSGNGLCEVCHTATAYHQSDGTSPAHHDNADCTACHAHDTGFPK